MRTDNPTITGQVGFTTITTNTPTGTTQAIDCNSGNTQILDLSSATGDVTVTFTNQKTAGNYLIEVIQHSSTARQVVWNNVYFVQPIQIPISTVLGSTTFLAFYYDSVNFFGSGVAQVYNDAYVSVSGSVALLDFDLGAIQTLNIGNSTGAISVSLANIRTIGMPYYIEVIQSNAGSATITWAAPSILWVGKTAPTITAAAMSVDVITIITDGTKYLGWYNQNMG